MIRGVVIFIAMLIFVPINVTAQDGEDVIFELLLEAWDSLEISQQTIVRAERIVRQERQINDSLRTEIEVLKQSKFNLNYVGDVFVFILLGVAVLGLFYYISRMKL
jgi:hypothetical protein